MTLTDKLTTLASEFSLIGLAGTFIPPAANVIDLAGLDRDGSVLSLGPDMGIGEEVCVQISPKQALDVVASIDAQLVLADNAALTTNPVVIGSTGALTLTQWNNGNLHPFNMKINPTLLMDEFNPNDADAKRYLGMRFITVTGTSTTGTVNARLVKDARHAQRHYPTKYVIK